MDNIRSFPVAIRQNMSASECDALCRCIMDIAVVDFAPDVALEFAVRSSKAYANGMLIFTPLGPEDMMALPEHEKLTLMKQYFEVARTNGVEVVGLGAYTSVISRGGDAVLPIAGDFVLTNGNSLTALATVESIRSFGQTQAPHQIAAMIGARGSVGKLTVMGLAHNYGHIILVGRPGSEGALLQDIVPTLLHLAMTTEEAVQTGSVLDKIRKWVKTQDSLPAVSAALPDGIHEQLGISADCDYETVLPRADCIVSATSEGKPFLRALRLKPNAIVFDAARPFDFHHDGHHHVYEGGLVQQPQSVNYSDCNMVGTPVGVNLACLSETIAIALDRVETHQSIGKNISYQSARNILRIAKKHGFVPVQYSHDIQLDEVRHAA
jgi:predicted amino acid dehydrogenase